MKLKIISVLIVLLSLQSCTYHKYRTQSLYGPRIHGWYDWGSHYPSDYVEPKKPKKNQ